MTKYKELSSLKRKEAVFGWKLVSPAVILIGVFILYPVLYNIYLSFFEVSLTPGQSNKFVGLENYRRLLTDPTFWNSFGITLLFVAITVAGSILVGLGVALLMNKEFPGRGIVRALILFPYVAPVISTVFAWQYVLMPLNGPLTILLSNFGIMDITQDVVNNPNNAFLVVSFYSIWKNFPFIYLMILSRLQSISQDYYEAADIDGANGWQKFRHITLPELYYVLGSLVLLRGIWNFYKFEEVYLLSKEARTLPIYLYQTAFTGIPDLGVAAAIATVLFIVMMALITVYVKKVLKW
ncbi:sugar ABC transporter permease [Petrotoga sp. 9PW.55.5.1]|jgi:multiple sugar transport system permease protein|uniref:carbohydrate ABC transporter permease n=1 Tax=Petrotoga sp. 9PW.55.5.1 TaxID=1308979 RepID=UPI000DC49F88|nr:sugar ABC transporter permease [Petrotoga sp. 9PW.55.5.1]RAO98841.1 sugar ABC transporter permease [Petrotoga sp. 9PW.55.5.1]